jgi:Tol biopolymer transport system component
VAFHSFASNLVGGDTNGRADVFVHDRQTGQTTRVSVASDGSQGNVESYDPFISADGRYVAFHSDATNLVGGDTNGDRDVFVHDRQTAQTTRVSVASDGSQGNSHSRYPSISADGRYVAFHSDATNLVGGDTNGHGDVFVHDRQTGQTTRVSVASDGSQGNSYSRNSSISADGRYVAFHSFARNLVGGDTNGRGDVFVHDRQTAQTTRVSVASDGSQGNDYSFWASISADGRYVAFQSLASNLVGGDTNGRYDVFVHDRQTGQTTRVSVASDGSEGYNSSDHPFISADGRYVAFHSDAGNLVGGDTNGDRDVFVHDRQTAQTTRVSVASDGSQGNDWSWEPSISADGRYVAFHSFASNLAGQLEMCRNYAQEHGYTIVAELAEDDRGASGAEIDLPQLNKVRDMAQAGEFDVLVAREIDRLSRNLAKQLIVEQELQRAGVQIEYVLGEYPDTPEGNLQKHVKAVIAEYEREKIKERIVRGKRQKVKSGHVMVHGNPPYGYQLGETDGKQTLIPYEPQARIVRLIYQLYTEGDGENGPLPLNAIKRKLTEMGVPTKGDLEEHVAKQRGRGIWNRAAVRNILIRETYAGVWHYGKVRENRKGKEVLNPRETWIPVKVPAIVSREQWEAAQERLEYNRRTAKRNTKHHYLLRCRVRCGKCGAYMAASVSHWKDKRYLYYKCAAANKRLDYARICEQKVGFRAEHVDATVWAWVQNLLLEPAVTLRGLREKQVTRKKASKPLRDRLTVVDDLIADNRCQLERALDLYLSGDFPREVLTERKARLQSTIDALEQERAELAGQLEAQTLTDEQIETIMEFAAKMGKGLDKAELDFEKRRRLIEELDVTVRLAVEGGQKVAHVKCLVGYDDLSITLTKS